MSPSRLFGRSEPLKSSKTMKEGSVKVCERLSLTEDDEGENHILHIQPDTLIGCVMHKRETSHHEKLLLRAGVFVNEVLRHFSPHF